MHSDVIAKIETALPLVISPSMDHEFLEDWMKDHKSTVDAQLLQFKAILFRGFKSESFAKVADSLFDNFLNYDYRSSPRTTLEKNIYTSTEYPKHLSILQHCENSYQRCWPMKLLFHCVIPASTGGHTPLTDMIKVTSMIDAEIKEEFEHKRIKYVRNYRPGVDLPWQEVFNTNDKKKVVQYCESNNITYEWQGDVLKTSQVCEAFAIHPKTQQKIWFNQAHLFHISSFTAEYQKVLLATFSEEGLPRNSYFGDGSKIDPMMLEHIQTIYKKNLVQFDWMKGDTLLIDNMLVSHGRTPYEGNRKIILCMAEPHSV